MLEQRHYGILTGAVIIIVAVLGGAAFFVNYTIGEPGARRVAEEFGTRLQKVSISGEAETVRESVKKNYGDLVTQQLLDTWVEDPSNAPGRLVSSPWPDHIEIDTVSRQGKGYVVSGRVVYMTSEDIANGGDSGTTPVVMQLIRDGGRWRIAAYEEQAQG